MTEHPVISIVIAVKNGANTLQRAIDSVSNQTYERKELVIIDGKSTDGTLRIIERNSKKLSYWVSEPDRGIYDAWNKSLRCAKGEWLLFLGADDYLWREDVLERIAPHLLSAGPEIRVVYGPVNVVRSTGTTVMAISDTWDRARFLQVMCIHHQGVFHHRTIFDIHGGFDESYRIAGDYEMLLRELKDRDAKFVPGIIIAGAQHGGVSSDPSRSLMVLREIVRARRQNSIQGMPLLLVWTFCKAIVHLALIRMLGKVTTRRVANLYRRLTGRGAI